MATAVGAFTRTNELEKQVKVLVADTISELHLEEEGNAIFYYFLSQNTLVYSEEVEVSQ
jgi:hypothetical protein